MSFVNLKVNEVTPLLGVRRSRIITVDATTTVELLKHRIVASVLVPAEQQRLVYRGRELLDDKFLKDYNIQPNGGGVVALKLYNKALHGNRHHLAKKSTRCLGENGIVETMKASSTWSTAFLMSIVLIVILLALVSFQNPAESASGVLDAPRRLKGKANREDHTLPNHTIDLEGNINDAAKHMEDIKDFLDQKEWGNKSEDMLADIDAISMEINQARDYIQKHQQKSQELVRRESKHTEQTSTSSRPASITDNIGALLDNVAPWMKRSSNDLLDAKQLEQQQFPLSILGIIILIVGLLICCCCHLACFSWCCCISDHSFMSDCRGSYLEWIGYASLDSDEAIAKVVRREARYMILLPLLPLAFLHSTTCEEGTPNIVYYLYVPFMIRARVMEALILYKLKASWKMYMYMLIFSTFEHLDWFTDGLFPVQAYACDALMTPRFANSFSHSMFPSLSGVVAFLHFWGLSVIVFLVAAFSQQAMASSWSSHTGGLFEDAKISLPADTAGFAAVADVGEEETGGFKLGPVYATVSKVFVENCLQLRIQASGFALTFGITSRWAKWKALLSMGLGLLSVFAKTSNALVNLCKELVKVEFHPIPLGLACLNIIAIVCAVWTAFQIIFAFKCPSHIWNLTSGCVD